jgi:hypothetical protein
MRAQDWIALYAAIVATAALIWQASTQLYERKPRLRVELGLTIFIATEEDVFFVKTALH